jgi:hypothetical protein
MSRQSPYGKGGRSMSKRLGAKVGAEERNVAEI